MNDDQCHSFTIVVRIVADWFVCCKHARMDAKEQGLAWLRGRATVLAMRERLRFHERQAPEQGIHENIVFYYF